MMLPILLLLQSAAQSNVVYLENMDLSRVVQGWGTAHARQSVQGGPISINGKTFSHGVGTHSYSEIQINLKRSAESFSSDVGLDDETNGRGLIRFEIWVDGKKLASSPAMRWHAGPEHLEVDLRGARKMRLIVDEAGEGPDWGHADWGDAEFVVKPGGKAPVVFYPIPTPPMPIAMGVSPRPEIHGARIFGCSPGNPFLFKIPATGTAPLRYSAAGLPSGLNLDPATGVISGAVANPGTYVAEIAVAGPNGEDRRKLTIVVGTHQLALTPPMGWNSWNVWGTTVNNLRIEAAADAFVKDGLVDYGYRYVNIDDAWEGKRAADGEITANEKFGDMAALAAYVHSKGLCLGIYSSPGPQTCAGYPGSYMHEEQDADTYAKWGVDYLKYDWCSYGSIAPNPDLAQMEAPYIHMRSALDQCGRDIVFSLCQYGMGDVYKWGKSIGGNLWRTTGDINDSYGSMSSIAFDQDVRAPYASPGGWNDPDMLVVGRLGWGDNPRPTNLTGDEQITHITMWSLLAAPLILGCDLTKLDPWTKALITNPDVIDVDQDPLGKAARRIRGDKSGAEVWARPLADGTLAVGLVNRSAAPLVVTATWAELGLKGPQPVRNCWLRKSMGTRRDAISVKVAKHGATLFRIGKISSD